MESENITYKQAAVLLGLPVGTVYSMVLRRQLPHVRLGPRSVRFNKAEIKAWIKSRSIPQKADGKNGTIL